MALGATQTPTPRRGGVISVLTLLGGGRHTVAGADIKPADGASHGAGGACAAAPSAAGTGSTTGAASDGFAAASGLGGGAGCGPGAGCQPGTEGPALPPRSETPTAAGMAQCTAGFFSPNADMDAFFRLGSPMVGFAFSGCSGMPHGQFKKCFWLKLRRCGGRASLVFCCLAASCRLRCRLTPGCPPSCLDTLHTSTSMKHISVP